MIATNLSVCLSALRISPPVCLSVYKPCHIIITRHINVTDAHVCYAVCLIVCPSVYACLLARELQAISDPY